MARTRQPQGPARVNWAHPLARELRFFVTCSGVPYEHVRGVFAVAANGADTVARPRGMAMQTANSGNKYWYVPYHSSYALINAQSVAISGTVGASVVTYHGTVSEAASNGASNTPFECYINSGNFNMNRADGGGYTAFTGSMGGFDANSAYSLGWSFSGASGQLDPTAIVANGAIRSFTVPQRGATGNITDGGANLFIGSRGDGATTANGSVDFVAGWEADIGAAGLLEILRNPWQLFAPQRRLWIQLGAASGGAAAVTGTLAATDGADSAAFAATHTAPAVTAALAATDGADIAAFAATHGLTAVTATLAATDGADIGAFAGVHQISVTATLAATDGADIAAFAGTHVPSVTGALAATDGADIAAFAATHAQAIIATFAATDGADSAAFAATLVGASIWTDIGATATTWTDEAAATTTWTDL